VITCKDCKHWDAYGSCARIVERPWVQKGDGLWASPSDATDDEVRALGAFIVPDVPSYPASLRTSADFGCVLGASKRPDYPKVGTVTAIQWRRFTLLPDGAGGFLAQTEVNGSFAQGDALRITVRPTDSDEWCGSISFDHPSGARIESEVRHARPDEALDTALQWVLECLSGPVWIDLEEATSSEDRKP
jgi:hypothetical protein